MDDELHIPANIREKARAIAADVRGKAGAIHEVDAEHVWMPIALALLGERQNGRLSERRRQYDLRRKQKVV